MNTEQRKEARRGNIERLEELGVSARFHIYADKLETWFERDVYCCKLLRVAATLALIVGYLAWSYVLMGLAVALWAVWPLVGLGLFLGCMAEVSAANSRREQRYAAACEAAERKRMEAFLAG
jgi:hypothetical protein